MTIGLDAARSLCAGPLGSTVAVLRLWPLGDRQRRCRALVAPGLFRTYELFVRRTYRGGERAAAIYSLIGTAKLNRIDSGACLREVLARISDHAINRIEELSPCNLIPTSDLAPLM
jgi:hypothetical protein